jgi:putative hydrolase
MSDDLFSRLFELFNQPGPVNWKLAEEVARHLAGEHEAIDPWEAEEQRELVRLAEYRIEAEALFAVPPASDVLVIDSLRWVELVMKGFEYLAEAIAESSAGSQLGPGIPGIGPTIAGMQVGSLIGSLSQQVPAAFESGYPVEPPGPILVIGPGVDRVVATTGAAPRDIRLWVAAEEVAHRALFGVPWLTEHLARLVSAYSTHLLPDPEKLMRMFGEDPERMGAGLGDPETLENLLESEESIPHRSALEAFLTITSGYSHVLAKRAVGSLLPDMDSYGSPLPETISLGLPVSNHERIGIGAAFCSDIERRFGREAVDDLWHGPERLPTAEELVDPVGWAARVLLDGL